MTDVKLSGLATEIKQRFATHAANTANPHAVTAAQAGAPTLDAAILFAGKTWTIRTSAADNSWLSVTYGNGLFVAVAIDGVGNRVMTSPDGITWTIRTSAADNSWYGVTYGNGLFVVVANTGTGNRVMTSGTGGLFNNITSDRSKNADKVGYKAVQTGSSSIVIATAGTAVAVTVTFTTPFATVPTVAIVGTTATGDAGYNNIRATAVSTTSVTFTGNSYLAQTLGFNWIAAG